MTENKKLCSFCDEPAVRGGKITAFCLHHLDQWRRYDYLYGWKTGDEHFERIHKKIRDVNFTGDTA
jgi:hypothetical protein